MHIYVVGSGMTGVSAARVLAESGVDVTVLEKKDVVSGNMHDPVLPSGYRIHKYGPHVFHTNSERVFSFLSRFTSWLDYEHKVLADIGGCTVPVPYNFNSIKITHPSNHNSIISHLAAKYKDNEHVPVLKLLESSDKIERYIAEEAYRSIFLEYTKKQWGMMPEEIGPSVTSRVPIRMGYDDRYFLDTFQGLPSNGYIGMIENMLDHPRITTKTNSAFSLDAVDPKAVYIYTGPVDRLLDFQFGVLPYRSLTFVFDHYPTDNHLPSAALNFTVDSEFTRKTDYSLLLNQAKGETYVSKEYPSNYVPGLNEPYYPIPKKKPIALHKKYADYLANTYPNIVLAGRLADYKYYNMDQACARGLHIAETVLDKHYHE